MTDPTPKETFSYGTADPAYFEKRYGADIFEPMAGIKKPVKPKPKKRKRGKK